VGAKAPASAPTESETSSGESSEAKIDDAMVAELLKSFDSN
jgi:hypothetical protein